MTTQLSPILLSDAPVDIQGDLIWKGSDVGLDVALISDTILQSEEPLVFAVHGPWGSGKTSFLRMIESELREQENQKIYISWYIASNYQAVGDVSTTLTLRILRTLSEGNTSASAEQLYDSLLRPSFELKQEVTGAYGFLEELAGKVAVLADLGVVIDDFLNGGLGAGKSKLVLMVDDLDRCSLEFIGNLVETIQRLSSVRNLFIFLAVDRTRLHNALEKRFADVRVERGPRWAGEKYIQHAIELPPLDNEKLVTFIRQSLMSDKIDDESLKADPALKTILDTTDYFAVAIRHKIPRTVKACINLIRPALTREITKNVSLSEDEKRKIVKRRLVEYLFRNFYTIWLTKAEADLNSPEFKFLIGLEDLCRTYFSDRNTSPDTNAMFTFSVERLKSANLLENRDLDVPEELARLLACPPFFAYEERLSEKYIKVGIEERFVELYNLSKKAEDSGDNRTSISAVAQAYELVRDNRQAVGSNQAWRLGNLAFRAENYKIYDLAEALNRLALQIDPTHVGNMLIFASFIIDCRLEQHEEAMHLLQTVIKKYPQHERIGRAYRLQMQLKVKLGESVDYELDQLAQIIKQTLNANEHNYTLEYLIKYGHPQEAVQLFVDFTAPKLAGTKELAEIQFNLAYVFTDLEKDENEYDYVAMDLYRQILEAPDTTHSNGLPIVMSNYAYLLQKHGYDNEASHLFYSSYIQKPDRDTLQRNFSDFLTKIGADELAKRVAGGELLDIDEPITIASSMEIPEHFSSFNIQNFLRKPEAMHEKYEALQDKQKYFEEKTKGS